MPITALAFGLIACTTALTPEQRMANFSEKCQAYGFKTQSDVYASCMMKLDQDDQRKAQKSEQCSNAALAAGPAYSAAYSLCMAVAE